MYHVNERQSLPILFAHIRLGCKYEFTTLRDNAISRMKREFPITLPETLDDDMWEHIDASTYAALEAAGDTVSEDASADLLDILEVAQDHAQLCSTLPGIYRRIEHTHTVLNHYTCNASSSLFPLSSKFSTILNGKTGLKLLFLKRSRLSSHVVL